MISFFIDNLGVDLSFFSLLEIIAFKLLLYDISVIILGTFQFLASLFTILVQSYLCHLLLIWFLTLIRFLMDWTVLLMMVF